MTADLYNAGYKKQSNIDFSSVAIASMKDKHAAMLELDWRVMDVRKMEFADCTFDFAIDKVGHLHASKSCRQWQAKHDCDTVNPRRHVARLSLEPRGSSARRLEGVYRRGRSSSN